MIRSLFPGSWGSFHSTELELRELLTKTSTTFDGLKLALFYLHQMHTHVVIQGHDRHLPKRMLLTWYTSTFSRFLA